MPPFVPYPPDSLRQHESSRSDEPSRLYFTQAFNAAMRIGYTRRDLAVMPYGEVIFALAAESDGRQPKREHEPDVVDATQEDIRAMLG